MAPGAWSGERTRMARARLLWVLFATFASVASSGCGRATAVGGGTMDANKALAMRFWSDVVNDGRFEVIDQIVAADYLQHQADVPPGREGLAAFQRSVRTAFPDQRATVEDVLVDGDRVMTRTVIRATHTGPLGKLAPTGRSIEITVIDVWRVQDGRLREHWGVLDNLSFMRQLGALPPPG
jgi:steroid delta-isomerase-like uncharacterized protein